MHNYVSTKDALTATAKTLITEDEKREIERIASEAPTRISEAFIHRAALRYMIKAIKTEGYSALFRE
jgi:hypothetical protein